MLKRISTIRSKLTTWFLLVSLLPLLVTSFLGYSISSSELLEKQKLSMEELVASTTKGMDQWLERRSAEIQLAANTEMIRSLDPARQTPFLKTIKTQSDVYETVVFTGTNGIIAAHTDPKSIGLDLNDRSYFKNGMAGKTTYSEPIVSKSTGNRIIVVGTPVKDESGKIIGVMSASMNFEALINTFVKELHIDGGRVYLVDNTGILQDAPNKEMISKKAGEAGLPQGLLEIFGKGNQEPGVAAYKDRGKEYVVAYSPVKQTGYGLYIEVPMEVILSAAQKIKFSVLGVVLAASALVVVVAYLIARNISRPIGTIASQVKRVASGDLSVQHIAVKSNDEIGRLAGDFNTMFSNLKDIIGQVAAHSTEVSSTAEQLSSIAEQTQQTTRNIVSAVREVNNGAELQVQGAEESARAMEEMAIGIQRIAESSGVVSEASIEMTKEAQQGNRSIQKAVEQMAILRTSVDNLAEVIRLLGDRSQAIGQIVEVISAISAQTNLLALNAAIEAARAGEHGKGFAVVADEVRKLAEQSEESARQIAELIQDIQADTNRSVQAMDQGTREMNLGIEAVNEAGEAFGRILSAAQNVANQIQEVSAASEELSSGSEEVAASVGEMARIAKESAENLRRVAAASDEQLEAVGEVASSAQSLTNSAEELQALLVRFKIN